MRAAYGSAVAFVLMNSFSTSDDTRAFFASAHPELLKVCGGRGRVGSMMLHDGCDVYSAAAPHEGAHITNGCSQLVKLI